MLLFAQGKNSEGNPLVAQKTQVGLKTNTVNKLLSGLSSRNSQTRISKMTPEKINAIMEIKNKNLDSLEKENQISNILKTDFKVNDVAYISKVFATLDLEKVKNIIEKAKEVNKDLRPSQNNLSKMSTEKMKEYYKSLTAPVAAPAPAPVAAPAPAPAPVAKPVAKPVATPLPTPVATPVQHKHQ